MILLLILGTSWYNTVFQSSIQITPYEDFFGHPPLSVPIYILRSLVIGEMDHQLRDHDEALTLLKDHLVDVQSRTKDHYNLRQCDVTFSIANMVIWRSNLIGGFHFTSWLIKNFLPNLIVVLIKFWSVLEGWLRA